MKMTSNTWLCLPACNTIQYPEWTILEPNIRRSSVSGFRFLWKQGTSSSLPLLSLSLHTLTYSPSLHTQDVLSRWCWYWGCKMESSIAHQVSRSVAEVGGCRSIDQRMHSLLAVCNEAAPNCWFTSRTTASMSSSTLEWTPHEKENDWLR